MRDFDAAIHRCKQLAKIYPKLADSANRAVEGLQDIKERYIALTRQTALTDF